MLCFETLPNWNASGILWTKSVFPYCVLPHQAVQYWLHFKLEVEQGFGVELIQAKFSNVCRLVCGLGFGFSYKNRKQKLEKTREKWQ